MARLPRAAVPGGAVAALGNGKESAADGVLVSPEPGAV